jgi:hypothetical protein
MPIPRSLLRLAVAASVAAFALSPAVAQTLDTASRTVTVAPSGGDDTSAIASAFSMCMDLGPGCTVQLSEGTFLTRQQDIEGFGGTFAGAGREATVIEALTPYVVSPPRVDISLRQADRSGAPVMFTFWDGDIVIRDMTLAVRGASPSETWLYAGNVLDVIAVVISFSGPTNRGVVERVAIEGERVGAFGVNVFNGIVVEPETHDAGGRAVAELEVRDTRMTGIGSGILLSQLRNSSIRVVGSDLDVEQALYLSNVGASTIVVVVNRLAGFNYRAVGFDLLPGVDLGGPTHMWIVDNDIVARGFQSIGIGLNDQSASGVGVVHVSGNRFELTNSIAGVRGRTIGTVVFGNSFAGTADVAIQVGVGGAGGRWLIADNDLGGLRTARRPILVLTGRPGVIVSCAADGQLEDLGTDTIAMCP